MYSAQFQIGARVKVPFSQSTQGVIVACHGRPGGQFDYVLRFVGDDGAVVDHTYPQWQLGHENPPLEEALKREQERLAKERAAVAELEAQAAAKRNRTKPNSKKRK